MIVLITSPPSKLCAAIRGWYLIRGKLPIGAYDFTQELKRRAAGMDFTSGMVQATV